MVAFTGKLHACGLDDWQGRISHYTSEQPMV